MIKKTKLSASEILELRNSHVKVSEEVFIMLADKYELEKRKDLVKRYGYHSNITFFSDGSVFINGRKTKGATGWIVANEPSYRYESV